nr:gamma carbonic anhydrase family protein [Herbidospora mongoliensis]
MAEVFALDDDLPSIDPTAWIAPGAVVAGRVRVGTQANVWYGSVLRGDDESIEVGAQCNVQDLCCLHADPGFPTVLEPRVSVGHRAVVHGAYVETGALVGIGAILMNGAHIGAGALVAAGSLVTPGKRFPGGVLLAGAPAKIVRDLDEDDIAVFAETPDRYMDKARRHARARRW